VQETAWWHGCFCARRSQQTSCHGQVRETFRRKVRQVLCQKYAERRRHMKNKIQVFVICRNVYHVNTCSLLLSDTMCDITLV